MAPATVAVIHISTTWVKKCSKEIMARTLTIISPMTCKGTVNAAAQIYSFGMIEETHQYRRAKPPEWV
jgi:hypothetical protein